MYVFGHRHIFCEENTCKYNHNGVCTRSEITVVSTNGLREDGTNGPIPACINYEDRRAEDAGAD